MLYGVVYRITCTETDKSYIGRTKRSLHKRWHDHCQRGSNCVLLKRAIAKYGKESFSIEAIASSWDKENLKELEAALIIQENTLAPNGYNLLNALTGITDVSEETKQRLRASWRAYWDTPGNREKKSKVMRELWQQAEYRERLSKQRKIAANEPRRKAKWVAQVLVGNQFNLGRKHSESEQKKRTASLKEYNLRKYGITFNGETLTMPDWAARIGIDRFTLNYRIKKWGLERALTTPKNGARGLINTA